MMTATTLTFVYSGTEVRVVMASITKMAAVVCIHLRYALGQIKAVTWKQIKANLKMSINQWSLSIFYINIHVVTVVSYNVTERN